MCKIVNAVLVQKALCFLSFFLPYDFVYSSMCCFQWLKGSTRLLKCRWIMRLDVWQLCWLRPHTHTHPFNGPFSRTTRVGRYQKGKTILDFTEARDSEWQWHQLGHVQVCTSLQTHNHVSTSPLSFFTGRMPFLPPNQQRQSTEGKRLIYW